MATLDDVRRTLAASGFRQSGIAGPGTSEVWANSSLWARVAFGSDGWCGSVTLDDKVGVPRAMPAERFLAEWPSILAELNDPARLKAARR